MENDPKKILLIDDSALMRRVMSDIINHIDGFTVAYLAADGEEGYAYLSKQNDIDVVMTDIDMPKMDGLTLIKKSKEAGVVAPFIVFSAREDSYAVFTALDLGAIEFIRKPEHIFQKDVQRYAEKIKKALCMAVEVKERTQHKAEAACTMEPEKPVIIKKKHRQKNGKKLVALVCSTGGPRALQSVIPKLPKNLAAPVVLVQHMPEGFTKTLAIRLNEQSAVSVKEAAEGDVLKNGHVYIAKGGTHLALHETAKGCEVFFDETPPIGGLKPCGNVMLSSLSHVSYDEIICVILTGMGADGTKGTQELAKHKPVYVIAQDEASSTVYGMPKAIRDAGLCDCVCDLQQIAEEITKKVGVQEWI